ncbi:MAG: hypothetical protein ACR2FG_11925 [Marmoricola sp.]
MSDSNQQQRPAQQPLGNIRLHVQGSKGMRLVTPSVRINGQPVHVTFGQNDIPVYPGPVTVQASTQWLREYGQAQISFDVTPGDGVEIWYAAPQHQFTTGSMGYHKQKPKGTVVMVGVVVIVVLLVIAFVVATR